MLYKDLSRILGIFLTGFSLLFFIPLTLALYYQFFADPAAHLQPHTSFAFFLSFLFCLCFGVLFYFLGRKAPGHLNKRESIALVVIIWFLTPIFAGAPFVFSRTLESPIDAYFEAVSGFTTTGSTILHPKAYDSAGKEVSIKREFVDDYIITKYSFYGTITPVRDPMTGDIIYEGVEALGKALLFWRSFIQWLGGGGIIVLFVAIFPALGMRGKLLYQSEVSSVVQEGFVPRIAETAFRLWVIYAALTCLEIFLLMMTNVEMEWLDAITISFSTLATGGFSIRNDSIGYYHSASTEWVVIAFMIAGGMSFSLFYFLIHGKLFRLHNPELLAYLFIVLISCGLASWYLLGAPKVLDLSYGKGSFSLSEAIRYGTFQIVSAMTTTGFFTADYDRWPYFVQSLMLIVMYIGGMSGSTSGGIKVIRFYMIFYIVLNKVESMFRPDAVRRFKVGSQEIDRSATITVLCFFLLALFTSVAAIFFFIGQGIDQQTALGMVACLVNNVGLSFKVAGPTESFAFVSDSGLLLSVLLMILGRLEYFAVLACLVPAFWKKTG